jgi:hypothetical protein
MTFGPFNGTLLGVGWGVGTVMPGITCIGELGHVPNPDVSNSNGDWTEDGLDPCQL